MTPEELGLPTSHGDEREAVILRLVETGAYDPIKWATLRVENRLELQVFADAFSVKGVRVNVSAETMQHIADFLGCCLPTPKIADMIWAQREVTLVPSPQPITSSTQAMIDHSARIDTQLVKQGNPEGLRSTVGKIWVIDPDILKAKKLAQQAMNYGWHFRPGSSFGGIKGNVTASLIKDPSTKQYVHMIQSRGWHHDIKHVDYSQVCRLVARDCKLDGKPADLADILRDPALCKLVSANGPLQDFRHPFVEQRFTGMTIFGDGP